MALTKRQFVQYLKDADFRTLFIEEMGWNKYSASIADVPTMYVDERAFNLKTIAHRNGFQVLVCNVPELPSNSVCKKLDTKLRKAANDYICIFVIPGTEHHQWVAPVKTNEKRDIVIIEYAEAEKAQFLFEKIAGLSFDLDEATTIVDVKERVQGAFAINSEKITKDFYSGFNKEHKAFADFITGIDDQIETKKNKNKQWYTSVMLNRLMFCYFIQKKGFLDGDEHYLRNKLHWVQEKKGKNQFFKSFYKGFLIQLFRGGLNSPKHDNAFEDMYGRIPYLNGGMFDVHQIERDYADIDIKDEAFVSLFEFFDKWRWHLDTRVTASGRDINPDVLGYIFEQYINDRAQMGAYYTKEDITEYIGRNTIIPYLFEATAKQYPEAFALPAPFWDFISSRGQDFIYDAVKKGVKETIPEEITRGLDTNAPNLLERRQTWNNTTPSSQGLPTEIWRETISRVRRYNEIVDKLQNGEINTFKDFITYNLNIPKIAYEFLNATDDRKFIEAFYSELLKVTILDPTCGSGAFLFAALNLLEPLYEVCISRMEEFNAQDPNAFKEQLAEIKNKYRSNIQYFIYKSIILRNLYGVDIMAEAVEIAKLRLFLKMVAVVEVDKRADNMGLDPLPDVDFNIRCGNTLVGYATEAQLYHDLDVATDFLQQLANQELKDKLQSKLNDVADTYELFRIEQLSRDADISVLRDAKKSLNKELGLLNALLNEHLYASTSQIDYNKWLSSYQPFHWFAEFYQIMHGNGGFDVVIGNPPYVEYSSVRKDYTISGYSSIDSGNLYAYVIERSTKITNGNYLGMIIPISAFCTARMESFMTVVKECSVALYVSNYAERPSKLFEGAERNLSIMLCKLKDASSNDETETEIYTTYYYKWKAQNRGILFQNISYIESTSCVIDSVIPKISSDPEKMLINRFRSLNKTIGSYALRNSSNILYYKNSGGRYWKFVANFKPLFYLNGSLSTSSRETHLYFEDAVIRDIMVAVLNSDFYFWYYVMHSDARTNNPSDLKDFPFNLNALSQRNHDKLVDLCKSLMSELQSKSVLVDATYRTGDVRFAQYLPALSRNIIIEIDKVLANHMGVTDEELDFIINYDIKYRLGEELNEAE